MIFKYKNMDIAKETNITILPPSPNVDLDGNHVICMCNCPCLSSRYPSWKED